MAALQCELCGCNYLTGLRDDGTFLTTDPEGKKELLSNKLLEYETDGCYFQALLADGRSYQGVKAQRGWGNKTGLTDQTFGALNLQNTPVPSFAPYAFVKEVSYLTTVRLCVDGTLEYVFDLITKPERKKLDIPRAVAFDLIRGTSALVAVLEDGTLASCSWEAGKEDPLAGKLPGVRLFDSLEDYVARRKAIESRWPEEIARERRKEIEERLLILKEEFQKVKEGK